MRLLRRATVIVFVGAGLLFGTAPSNTADTSGDWVSPDALATAVYAVVSGPARRPRDWDRYRALFRRDARLLTFGGTPEDPKVFGFGIEDYIKFYEPEFDKRGVYEKEIWHRGDRFGRVAHRWSTCEYRWDRPDGPPAGRCITTMQFVHDGARWWITSMVWEGGLDPAAVPARYLPANVVDE